MTVSFISFVYNTSIAILNITSFNDIEEVTIKTLLLIKVIIILIINLTSIFNITNCKFEVHYYYIFLKRWTD